MTSALRTGIYNAALTASGCTSANVFFEQGKNSLTGTFVIIYGVNNPLSFDSASKFETDYVQFKIYGSSLSGVETMAAALQAVFDFGKARITVSGWSVVTCVRVLTNPPHKTENVWETDIEYKIETQKAR